MDIKKTRKVLNLNTSKFGDLIGVSGRTIEDWEQGRHKPSKSVLMLLSKLIKEDDKK